jgi:hypothetical protein
MTHVLGHTVPVIVVCDKESRAALTSREIASCERHRCPRRHNVISPQKKDTAGVPRQTTFIQRRQVVIPPTWAQCRFCRAVGVADAHVDARTQEPRRTFITYDFPGLAVLWLVRQFGMSEVTGNMSFIILGRK